MIDKLIGEALQSAEAPCDWHALNRVQVHDVMRELARVVVLEVADRAFPYDEEKYQKLIKCFGVKP